MLSLPLMAQPMTSAQHPQWRCTELKRYAAPEANQAVAVDDRHFYAIGNHILAKYDKHTGRRLAVWECERGKPLVHLNSGVVRDGLLYCAHSNFPELPMASSIEVWDAATMRHHSSHSFGIFAGSATWLDYYQGHWYVTFGHYGGRGGEPNRDARYTSLIQFDAQWRRLQAWVYPSEVVARLGQYSISGGVFLPDGAICCTGHDEPELYFVSLPKGGSSLVFEAALASQNPGQGIARDPAEPGILYGIHRARREIVVMRLQAS